MTSEQQVYAYNSLSDVVGLVPAHYLEHPILGANLTLVRNGKTRGRLSEIVGTSPAETEDTEEAPGPPTEPIDTIDEPDDEEEN